MSDHKDIPLYQEEHSAAAVKARRHETVESASQGGAYSGHPLETRHALPMALLRARETIMSHFRPMLNAHGISEQQWRVMRVLAEEDDLDATEIAERTCIFASSLSRIIKTLEKQDALMRKRNSKDARRVRLRLTEKGYQTVSEMTPESLAVYADIEERFGTERVATLIGILNELVDMGSDDSIAP